MVKINYILHLLVALQVINKMSHSLTFEEFQTAQRRRRALRNGLDIQSSGPSVPPKKEDPDQVKSINETEREVEAIESVKHYLTQKLSKAGLLAESIDVQTILVVLIWLDLVASATSIALDESSLLKNSGVSSYKIICHQLLQSFSSFALVVFMIELQTLTITFGIRAVLSHPGYMVDCFVVFINLYSRLSSPLLKTNIDTSLVRFISLLRVWRLARLFSCAMEKAKEEHIYTLAELEELELKTGLLKNETLKIENRLKQEREAKLRVEKILQGYKDENETLAEALEIAAYDVAVVIAKDKKIKEDIGTYIDGGEDQFYDGKPDLDESISDENLSIPPTVSRIIVHRDGKFETKQDTMAL